MERRFKKIISHISIFLIFVFFALIFAPQLFCQTPSFEKKIRLTLWAEIDAYPGTQNLEADVFDFPISQLKKTVPLFIEGMVYGWNFSYTPSDRTRNVEEFFEITPINENKNYLKNIKYSSPTISDERINVWVEFERTPEMVQLYRLWSSISNPVATGRGTGKISKGFEGVSDAMKNSVKDAVRNYFRTKIINKPKEIRGKVLVKSEPTFGISRGEYVIQLDFFIETDTILEYNNY